MKHILSILLLLLGLFLFLCARPAPADANPLPVAVSIAPQKYLLERIAGDAVSVTVLVKPGSDPHSYEPSPAQMRAVSAAKAWFTIGVPFEDTWTPRIQGAAKDLKLVSCIKGITRLSFADDARLLADLELSLNAASHDAQSGKERTSSASPAVAPDEHEEHDGHDHAHEGADPHVWLSPMLVRQMLPGLAKELGKLVPEKRDVFRANADALADELDALDGELAARFSEFPRERRVFLTFHPSWRYFAHNYQLTELSIEQDGKEPGPQSLRAVTEIAKRLGIRTVFVEPQFPKASAEAVAAAIGADIQVLDPLAEDLPALYKSTADALIESFKR